MKNVYLNTFFSKFSIILLTFLSNTIVTRYLGAELKGEYAYIFNSATIVSLILTMGIGYSYSFFKRENQCIKSDYITVVLFQQVLYTLLFGFSARFFSLETNLIILISIILSFNIQVSYIILIENIKKRNSISFITWAIYLFVLVYLFTAKNSNRLELVIIAYLAKMIFEIILYLLNIKFTLNKNIKSIFILSKRILSFGAMTMIITLLINLNYNIDILILKNYVSLDSIGIYSLAVSIVNLLWIIPDIFKDIMMNKSAKEDNISDLLLVIKLNVVIAIIVMIGFSLFGKVFIHILYGREFARSFDIVLILLIGLIPMILYKLTHTLYLAKGKQIQMLKILVIAVLLNVVLNYITIPMFGIKGAAWASVVSYSICGILFFIDLCKENNVRFKDVFSIDSREIVKMLKKG